MRYIAALFIGLVIGVTGMYLWKAQPLLPPAGAGPDWLIVSGHDPQNDSAWKLNMRTGELRHCLAGAAVATAGCAVFNDINGPRDLTAKPAVPLQ